MKKLRLFLILYTVLLLVSGSVFAQNKEFLWAHKFGGEGRDSGNSITTDAEGNVYTTRYFERTADFDPGPDTVELNSTGYFDIFIQKLDPNGNLLWVKQIGDVGRDETQSIAIDGLGNIYTTGAFTGTVDFDPGTETHYLTADGSTDIFVLKLDQDGNFIWAKQMGGTDYDEGFSIAIDALGNVLVVGLFSGTADFDPSEGTAYLTEIGTVYDMFILKLDGDGNFIWVKQIGGIGGEVPTSLDTDSNGNVYTTGKFYYTADFNPSSEIVNLTSLGSSDIFILKLDGDGDFLWVKQMGGVGIDDGNSITIDQEGSIYSTGSFNGTVDFDPGTAVLNFSSAGKSDVYIQKLDLNGNLLWVMQIGGTNAEIANAIATDGNGNIYILGNFAGTVDFDPGSETRELTAGLFDNFILKLDGNGNFIWVTQNIGTYGPDHKGNAIAIDADNNVLTTGYFVFEVDFDPGEDVFNIMATIPYWDIFVQKLGTPSLSILEIPLADKFVVHPNPTKGKFSVEFKTFQKSLSVRLFSITGQLLLDKHFQNTKSLDLELEQSAGMYLLELKDDHDHKATVRIVKH